MYIIVLRALFKAIVKHVIVSMIVSIASLILLQAKLAVYNVKIQVFLIIMDFVLNFALLILLFLQKMI